MDDVKAFSVSYSESDLFVGKYTLMKQSFILQLISMAITRSFPTSKREILFISVSFHRIATPALPRGILKLESQQRTNDQKFAISLLNQCFSKSQNQCSCKQTISFSLQNFCMYSL